MLQFEDTLTPAPMPGLGLQPAVPNTGRSAAPAIAPMPVSSPAPAAHVEPLGRVRVEFPVSGTMRR